MKRARVISLTVIPNAAPIKAVAEGPMAAGKAQRICDKLNDAVALADLDPNRITTYMVEAV